MTTDFRTPYPANSGDDAQNKDADQLELTAFERDDEPKGSVAGIETDTDRLTYRGSTYSGTHEREASAAITQQRLEQGTEDPEAAEWVYRGVRYVKGERYAPDKIKVTNGSSNSLVQWFYDRRVTDKQLTGLLASKMLSVLGIIGVSLSLLSVAGRSQLQDQAASELSATAKDLNSLAGASTPSDDVLVEAAETYVDLDQISDELRQETQDTLQARQDLNQLDYVAIVSLDFQVIANSTSDRSGDLFNPSDLVSSALRESTPQSTLSLQTTAELQRLGISIPSYIGEAALVQYAVIPIFEDGSSPAERVGNAVIGALVTGEIIDSESPIVADSLTNFTQGYSEIYLQEPSGSFDLVALARSGSVVARQNTEASYDYNFLDKTIQAANGQPDSIVTERFRRPDGNRYTVAAAAILDGSGKPVGVIQRGLPESDLQRLLGQATWLLIGTALLALLADVIIARVLGRSVAKPLRNLQVATESFASGNRSARADVFARDEVGQVASAFNELAATVTSTESFLRFQSETETESARRARTLTSLTSDIRKTLEESAIFESSVERTREVLAVDRVLIYRFSPSYTGGVAVAESVEKGWSRAKGQTLEDPMLPNSVERFKTGRVSFVEDVEKENLTDCHCRLLRELEVQANMVAPIVVGGELVALLCAHECSGPRQWQPEEINMIDQIATQIGFALSQARLLASQKTAIKREQQLSELVGTIREMSVDDTSPAETREKIFRLVTRKVKVAIESSRVLIYLFDEDWQGTIVAESVDTQWPAALGAEIADPCFADKYVDQYRDGRVKATSDISQAGLTACHLKQLEPFEVKASLVAPIVVEDKLLGLLVAHECSGPRTWSTSTINFIQRAATQLGFALEQAEANTQKAAALRQANTLADELTQRQEALQMQLIELLSDVEAAADGNLTVRADVTAGEIGTVADFFNAIVENLSQVVTQVKTSAAQVDQSLGQNEGAIRVLADEAQQQAQQTTLTLDSVGAMTTSIQQVAQQAEAAAAVAKSAAETAMLGGEAMDLTVSNIMSLRQTVGQTAKKVKRLGESSQQITKAVSLINQISQQTNMLAINAGIEAAKAGEGGQGFAAVAEEVSELATRSATATEEIERIVEAIQRETSDVVEAIEESTVQVVEGTHRVEDAKASLNQILDGSQKMDELARQISKATGSQAITSATVSTLMEEIAQLAQRTSDSSRQVAAALDKTLRVSNHLQSQVATFVVDERRELPLKSLPESSSESPPELPPKPLLEPPEELSEEGGHGR